MSGGDRATSRTATHAVPAGVTAGRALLGAAGVALAAYGGWLLVAEVAGDREASVSVAVWLAGGVLLHDAVLVPAALALGWLAGRVLPGTWRAGLAAGLVVLGPVTLVGLPLLSGRAGTEVNPTLHARDYLGGWAVLALLVTAGAVAAALLRRRRSRAAATRGG